MKASSWYADARGHVELRGKSDTVKLNGLVIECDVLRLAGVKWHWLEKIGTGKSPQLVAGPYRIHVDAAKDAATVICEIDRQRPVKELDVLWLFAALQLRDHKFRTLVSTGSAANHHGGATEYALPAKAIRAFPLALVVPIPKKVTREHVRFAFGR